VVVVIVVCAAGSGVGESRASAGFGLQARWAGAVRDLSVAPDGSVYALSDRGLERFSADGVLLFERADPDLGMGQVAAAPSGVAYVTRGDAVDEFSPAGELIRSWSVYEPEGVVVAADGTVWVSGRGSGHFSADGVRLPGPPPGRLELGHALSIDPAGFLYQSKGIGVVLKYNPRTNRSSVIGDSGSGPGQFYAGPGSYPGGPDYAGDATVQSGQRLWVVDHGNGRIESFTLAGVFAGQCASPAVERPVTVAAAPNGDLYVGEESGEIRRLGPVTGSRTGCHVAPRVDRLRVRYERHRSRVLGAITLSERAGVQITLTRNSSGVPKEPFFYKPFLITHRRAARGRNTFQITRRLKPGVYQVSVTPTTRDHRLGATATADFTVRGR